MAHGLRKIVLYRCTEWREEKMSGGSVWSGKKNVRFGAEWAKNDRFGAEWAKKYPVRRGVGKKIFGSARSVEKNIRFGTE